LQIFEKCQNKDQLYTKKKIKIWKLKEIDNKEQFQQLLRTKLPKDETQSVEEEWGRFKTGFIEAAEEVCSHKSGMRRYKEIPWWTDRVKEVVRRKIMSGGRGSNKG
jgi:hypothetical protein